MRVCLLTPSFFPVLNGITFRVKMITDYLVSRGHYVIIGTSSKQAYPKYKNTKVIQLPSKKLSNLMGGKRYSDVYQYKPKNLDKLFYKLIKKERIDIVHLFGPEQCSPFMKACNDYDIPFIMSMNTETTEFMSKATKIPYFICNWFNRFAFLTCGVYQVPLILGTSLESIRLNLKNKTISKKQRTKLMLPAVNIKLFKPTRKRKKLFKKNCFRLIYCGRIAPEKGIDKLIRTMKYLNNAQLVIVGGGNDIDRLKKIANKIKVDQNVEFVGKVPNDQLPKYYSTADLFMTASKGETCGFTTLEAMSCGTPALVYPLGGSINIVTDSENGFWCKTEKDFADKVKLLQKNKLLLKQMSKCARNSVKKYSVENSCRQLLKDYQHEIKLEQKIDIKKATWWNWFLNIFSRLG